MCLIGTDALLSMPLRPPCVDARAAVAMHLQSVPLDSPEQQ